MSPSKTPFYRHTSILLAIAFTAGVGVGSLSDSLDARQTQDSVLHRSRFIKSLTKSASIESVGKSLAYEVYDGQIVDDKVGDDESASDVKVVRPEDALPVPKIDTSNKKSVNDKAPAFDFTISCDYEKPEKPVYKGSAMIQNQAVSVAAGGKVEVTIAYKNEGNVPWFSNSSGCKDEPVVQLGTTHELDRASIFAIAGETSSGWADTNRIHMTTPRVDPGASALFTFTLKAPSVEDVYREMFGVVIPGKMWVKYSDSALNITVGRPYDEETAAKKFFYINGSGSGAAIDISAPKSVMVDLSEQKATLKLGEYVVREFFVSSGARKTPTPVGTWKILFKQQARIGGASPHYIMPKWQAIRPDGYGFHALPVLGNASLRSRIRALGPDVEVPTEWFTNDAFWSEALDHIGTPRSHGCVRFLPDDAAYTYDFTDVGTPVIVQK